MTGNVNLIIITIQKRTTILKSKLRSQKARIKSKACLHMEQLNSNT